MSIEVEKVKKVKAKVNKLRIEESAELATVDKMAEQTKAVIPEDIETMFAAKMYINVLKLKVANGNIMWAYLREYFNLDDETYKKLRESGNPLRDLKEILGDVPFISTFENLLTLQKEFENGFAGFKNKVAAISEEHSLCQKFEGVLGLGAVQVALIMAEMKDVARFSKPDNLCMWAGCASVKDMETGKIWPVTKANIKHIAEVYAKQGKEFKGFNTMVAGRMTVIYECLMRSKGFFFNYNNQLRERLMQRAINNGECFEPTDEQVKESKGKLKKGELYMKGKKNQSLKMWTLTNAKRRIQRIFLNMLWLEWRKLRGLPIVNPYVQDYLGHNSIVTLDQVLKADAAIKAGRKGLRKNKTKDSEESTEGLN